MLVGADVAWLGSTEVCSNGTGSEMWRVRREGEGGREGGREGEREGEREMINHISLPFTVLWRRELNGYSVSRGFHQTG